MSINESLSCHVINRGHQPQRCMIWLHGLGADGFDLAPLGQEVQPEKPTRLVFPHAPRRAVSINGGMSMPAWYDIADPQIERYQDDIGIEASRQQIQGVVDALLDEGFVEEQMILAGFSQGGAMAVYCGLRQKRPLAGIIALSCYQLLPDCSHTHESTPIFIGHGTDDPVVPVSLGQSLAQALHPYHAVKFHDYPMEHAISAEEICDIRHWLRDIGFWND